MIALVQGPLDVSGLITHRTGIDDYKSGFDAMRNGLAADAMRNGLAADAMRNGLAAKVVMDCWAGNTATGATEPRSVPLAFGADQRVGHEQILQGNPRTVEHGDLRLAATPRGAPLNDVADGRYRKRASVDRVARMLEVTDLDGLG